MERKEAIEVIKKNWPDNSFTMLREALETVIPELKDEDEKIRKQTFKVLNYYKDEEKSEGRMPTEIDECIAWLEKQGEQKPTDKTEPKFKVGDTITDPTDSTFTFHINAIKDGKYMESDKDWVLIKEADSDYELVEQKPAWSKEDEKQARQIERIVHNEGYSKKLQKQISDWLKSLKDRVQPKQEWSEEDIVAIDCAVEVLSKDLPSLAASIERLKSLRPQNKWKPSEGQMASITCAVRKMKESACYDSELVSLLNDLKKLKG